MNPVDIRTALLTGLLLLLSMGQASSQPFIDATEQAGITADGSFFAGTWSDVDDDGDFDLFVADGTRGVESLLYVNNGDGTYTRRLTGPVASLRSGATFGKWVDWDGDGDRDLFVSALSGMLQLFENDGKGDFSVFHDAAVESVFDVRRLGIADYDGDGDVDIAASRRNGATNVLLRNESGIRFERVTEGPIAMDRGNSTCVEWADIDNDGDQDLLVCNSGESNFLYENSGNGRMTRRTDTELTRTDSRTGDSAWADFDGDGDLDLYMTNVAGQQNEYYRNDGEWVFTRVHTGIHVEEYASSNSSAVADFDNDGDLDIYVANIDRENFLYTNLGSGVFRKIEFDDSVIQQNSSFHASAADGDGDGDQDIFVSNVGQTGPVRNRLYINGTFGNNWIHVRLNGRQMNTAGTGARITAYAGIGGERRIQIREMTEGSGTAAGAGTVAFGLGNATLADSITVLWPSGTIQTFNSVPSNQIVTFIEPEIHITLDAPRVGRPHGPLRFQLQVGSEDGPPEEARLHFRSVGEDTYFTTQFVPQTPSTFEAGFTASNADVEYYITVIFDDFVRWIGMPDQPRTIDILEAPPQIKTVEDVPSDEGGQVQIVWLASALDVDRILMPRYSIWRSTTEAVPAGETGTFGEVRAAKSRDVVNHQGRAWEWIADQPSLKLDQYAYTARTLNDRTAANDGRHWFMVVAHTDDPNVFFPSEPVSGFSIDNNGPGELHTGISRDNADVPTTFALDGNYPNPFSRRTTVRVAIPRPTRIIVKVVDALGRTIETLGFRPSFAGRFDVPLEMDDRYAPGVYVVTLVADGQQVASSRVVKTH